MILLVMLCQTLVYREVTALFSLKSARLETDDTETMGGKDPWSKTLNWYFFAVTNYFLYGESIIYYFKARVLSSKTYKVILTVCHLARRLCRCATTSIRNESSHN
jgi:hypothetical protein